MQYSLITIFSTIISSITVLATCAGCDTATPLTNCDTIWTTKPRRNSTQCHAKTAYSASQCSGLLLGRSHRFLIIREVNKKALQTHGVKKRPCSRLILCYTIQHASTNNMYSFACVLYCSQWLLQLLQGVACVHCTGCCCCGQPYAAIIVTLDSSVCNRRSRKYGLQKPTFGFARWAIKNSHVMRKWSWCSVYRTINVCTILPIKTTEMQSQRTMHGKK